MGTFTFWIIFDVSPLFSITSVILKFIAKKMSFLVVSKYWLIPREVKFATLWGSAPPVLVTGC